MNDRGSTDRASTASEGDIVEQVTIGHGFRLAVTHQW